MKTQWQAQKTSLQVTGPSNPLKNKGWLTIIANAEDTTNFSCMTQRNQYGTDLKTSFQVASFQSAKGTMKFNGDEKQWTLTCQTRHAYGFKSGIWLWG